MDLRESNPFMEMKDTIKPLKMLFKRLYWSFGQVQIGRTIDIISAMIRVSSLVGNFFGKNSFNCSTIIKVKSTEGANDEY